jgi:phosphopantetheinyl transferase
LNDTHLALPGPELMGLISDNFGLSISITHCPKLVAVALGKGQLGLDCEAAGGTRNWLRIADHFFTREEATTIASASTAEHENLFLRHWVLKESYIKSIKGSVFGDLNRLTLTEFAESANVEHRVSGQGQWAWVGSFAAHVLGIYCSDMSPPKLTFYNIENVADENFRLQSVYVEGQFIPIY